MRRWFRFSFRALLMAIAGVSLWLGWNYRIVQERKAVREILNERHYEFRQPWPEEVSNLSWIRRQLGDKEELGTLWLIGTSDVDEERVRKAFPECDVSIISLGRGMEVTPQ
jgi:hypothetical protein